MPARFDYISAILNVRIGEAVEVALQHSLDMIRLCRADNLGVRSLIPALNLRLGRDQGHTISSSELIAEQQRQTLQLYKIVKESNSQFLDD
ncbi:hypothetical protein FGRMN_3680 [Fusarium graminum]|nr:hypothetical protein FGRMN_3680 [Fusarium graminum]